GDEYCLPYGGSCWRCDIPVMDVLKNGREMVRRRVFSILWRDIRLIVGSRQ
ncbi:unnamed protein product, partial [Staurois parvus]